MFIENKKLLEVLSLYLLTVVFREVPVHKITHSTFLILKLILRKNTPWDFKQRSDHPLIKKIFEEYSIYHGYMHRINAK